VLPLEEDMFQANHPFDSFQDSSQLYRAHRILLDYNCNIELVW